MHVVLLLNDRPREMRTEITRHYAHDKLAQRHAGLDVKNTDSQVLATRWMEVYIGMAQAADALSCHRQREHTFLHYHVK